MRFILLFIEITSIKKKNCVYSKILFLEFTQLNFNTPFSYIFVVGGCVCTLSVTFSGISVRIDQSKSGGDLMVNKILQNCNISNKWIFKIIEINIIK